MRTQPPALDNSALSPRHRWRMLKDRFANHAVGVGGISVIIAIVLIFFYLVYVVFPLFLPAEAEKRGEFALVEGGEGLFMALEEQAGYAVRYTRDGRAIFFDTSNGAIVSEQRLWEVEIQALAADGPEGRLLALAVGEGQVLLLRHRFVISYPNDQRTVTPRIEFPYGEEPLELDPQGRAIERLALRDGEEQLSIAARVEGGELQLARFTKEESFLDEGVTLEPEYSGFEGVDIAVEHLLMDLGQERLYAVSSGGELLHYDIRGEEPSLVERVSLTPKGVALGAVDFLIGGNSLLVGGDDGSLSQWFPVRDENNRNRLQRIRGFSDGGAPVVRVGTEHRRKGFFSADADGQVAIHHTTAERTLLNLPVSGRPLLALAVSPRAKAFLAEDVDGRMHFWEVHNEHPEVSWSSLWGEVHYEGYTDKDYIWQSSSASNDFEPKFSLMPLAFGTLKAAFYAMLVAVPLAILGAIFTAYFMAPRMRQVVKPSIEIMEALPTVILGFLAGLWLAPVVESHLPGIFALLIFMPFGILLFAFAWRSLPESIRLLVPDGWEAALLIPVVLFFGWLSFALSAPMEQLFFGGDMRAWMQGELGIGFDQRNSLVVGLAMGFAVIPTIFSITEDAIFSVPKHLSYGSLALGATPWQTLTRVVILTASPGIFSAVMIGLGRAVGETMIVLMATGNTPVMDFSIFQGMRTLSANIAVEMPESEVASTHYRVLFLAALVLFLFTFVFNTMAEIVRQRLRRKYSSL